MRKDDGVDGDAQRLSQLVWLIFLKVLDDDERAKEFLDHSYKPAVPEKYRWKTWAGTDEGVTGDRLLNFVNNDLFPALKELPIDPSNKRTTVVKEVFANSFNYMKNGTQLRKVINKINDLDFNATDDRHAFGDIYETLLSSLQSAGNAGEFYTPRPITKFIVEMVNPKLGERVFDPACGTGGFLTNAIDHIRKEVKTPDDEAILQKSILGVEKKQLPYTLCVTNMIFHGLEEPDGVRRDNTLARPLISYSPSEYVDCITANPPFGGSEEDGIEDNFPSELRTRETADLFLVLFVRLLKQSGRAGIVLPDGTLFGEGVKTRIKKHLLEECNLHTIIRLPGSVFAPYTSIATNLLFFDKGEPTKEIWYYEHRLPEGVKAYNKTKPIRSEEFDPIKAWWHDRKESDICWKVGIEEIEKRGYNLDIKNPNTKNISQLTPEDILTSYREKWNNAYEVANKLAEVLKESSAYKSNRNFTFLTDNLKEYLHIENSTKLLKKEVLRLAVSGQLVPQIESEGTGEELYEIIAKSASIKPNKNCAKIDQPKTQFDIPKSWRWSQLGKIVEINIGKTPSRTEPKYWGEDIPWVSIADLSENNHISTTKEMISDTGFEKSFRSVASKAGTLLYSFKLTIGKMSIIDIDAVHNEAIASLSTGYPILTEYLFRALRAIDPLENTNQAVMGKTLNSQSLAILPVPLPPLAEQSRIVQKVDEIFALISELEAILGVKQ